MKCNKCGHELQELFTSVYCPNGCEKKWDILPPSLLKQLREERDNILDIFCCSDSMLLYGDEIRGLRSNVIMSEDECLNMPMDIINLIISNIKRSIK